MKKYFVESPPPTPNGKLHLGHMAGPYMAADIFNRVQRANGDSTFFACDLDRSQSYVRLAAIKNGITRNELLEKNTNSIRDTFINYDIGFDLFNAYDTDDRTQFIINFINPLIQSKYVSLKEIEFYFDERSNKFLVEAFISGICPKCSTHVKGGWCEICGYYNFSTNLLNPFSTIDPNAKLIKRGCRIYTLNGEFFRAELKDILNRSSINTEIKEFIFQILSDANLEFPITLPLEDGIPLGLSDTKLNPWIEVLGGTYYLKDIAKKTLDCENLENLIHVSFAGIDNAFYYTITCNLIRICLGLKDFPSSYFINKYYLLNNSKFSTSRNNVVWADEVAEQFDINLLRIFLSVTHPDKENYHFQPEKLTDFKTELENNDWVNKLSLSIANPNLTNTDKLYGVSPLIVAQLLLDNLNHKNNYDDNVHYLVQTLCPSLSKKIIRQTGVVPQIVRKASNSFKKEYGVKVNRLIYLNEHQFSSSIVIVEQGKQTDPHKHDELDELFYIIQGSGVLEFNNQQSIVNEGDYIYIPGGISHTLKHRGDTDLKFVTIAWLK